MIVAPGRGRRCGLRRLTGQTRCTLSRSLPKAAEAQREQLLTLFGLGQDLRPERALFPAPARLPLTIAFYRDR